MTDKPKKPERPKTMDNIPATADWDTLNDQWQAYHNAQMREVLAEIANIAAIHSSAPAMLKAIHNKINAELNRIAKGEI